MKIVQFKSMELLEKVISFLIESFKNIIIKVFFFLKFQSDLNQKVFLNHISLSHECTNRFIFKASIESNVFLKSAHLEFM